MTEAQAIIVVATATRAARDLGEIVHLIDDADGDIKKAIASAVYDIMNDVIYAVLSQHEALRDQVERRVEAYGRAF